MMKAASSFINVKRLLVAALFIATVLLPLYFLELRQKSDGTIAVAELLKTPPIDGQDLAVGVDAGKLAPDFEISTPEGGRLRLSDLRGRPVVINFWATWCTSCLTEMPEIKALQQERGIETFSVLAVNAGETRDRAMDFIDFLDAPFLYGLDVGLVVSDAYSVYGLPLSVFIDSSGVVRAVYRGHADRPRLETLTKAAIEARPPGEIPFNIRLVSTIYRERVLEVAMPGAGRLTFTSRSLRCDASYCAELVIDGLRKLNGIQSASAEAKGGLEPRLSVRYNPAVITEGQVVQRLAAALGALEDPVYTTELEIRYSTRP